MTLAAAATVGLQYRTKGAADKARRSFERYMLALGIAWKVERRTAQRPTAVFACGCTVQIRAFPVNSSIPILCAKHGKGAQ